MKRSPIRISTTPLLLLSSLLIAASPAMSASETTLSLIELNKQIRIAEDTMYDLFNELNDDDRYDIHCLWDRRTGTRISKRICKPQFVRKATSLNARSAVAEIIGNAGATGAASTPPKAEINLRYPMLEEKMRTLANNNPELLAAAVQHQDLLEQYDARLAQKKSK